MKKLLLFFLCLTITLLHGYLAQASHIVGGEMSYTCLGNDQYQVTLKVYRDCYNGLAAYDNPAYIFIFDANGTMVQYLQVTFPGSDTLPNNANNPCLIVPPNICVEEAIYTSTVTLPPSDGGYTLVYQRCCRNITISNIFDPSNTGASYVATIPDTTVAVCNNSPYYNNFPPTVICVDQPFSFDHSATDPDGDSLVYSLCSPYLGADALNPQPTPTFPPAPPPYGFVTFLSPYSETDPMGGTPPMNIDPQTGLLTVTPNTIGQFVVGVCVSEYRNGQFLGEHKRDFQFNVASCQPSVIASIPNIINNCSSYTVSFENNSFGGTYYHWDFGVPGSTTDTSNAISPSFTYPDTGVYTVTLYVNPGTTCGDTTTATVYIYPTLTGGIAVPDGCIGLPVPFADQTVCTFGTVDSWSWDFGDGQNSTSQDPSHTYDAAGDYTVQLIVGNSVGCVDTVTQEITIFPKPTVVASPHDTTICYLDAIQLTTSVTGGSNYNWQPNYNLTTPTGPNPVASPDVSLTYTVTVSNSFGCTATDTVHINVFDTVIASAGPDTTICPGGVVQLNGSGGLYFSWSPSAGLNSATISNPVATPSVTTTYVMTTSVGSCVGTDAVTIFVKQYPNVTAGDDQTICPGDSVMITASGVTDYSWSPPESLTDSHSPNPIAFPSVTTTYVVSGTDSNACPVVDTDTLTVNVVVIPPIFVSDDTTIILGTSAYLQVNGGTSWTWVPPTGLSDPNSSSPVATPTETITYYVYITTAEGCPIVDSVKVTVNPEPVVVFPSAFSPNQDGKNDYFRPVILGLAKLDNFRIYNRWGEVVFEINNTTVTGGPLPVTQSWDGKYKNEDQPIGVYVYYLKGVGSATGTQIERQGNFTLVR